MTKNKIIVMISCIMMALGLIIYGIGVSLGGRVVGLSFNSHGVNLNIFDLNRSITSVVEKEDTLDSFSSIDIELDYSDVSIIPSDHFGISYKTNIYSSSNNKAEIQYEVRDNTLYLTTSSYSNYSFTVFGSSVQNTIEHTVIIYVPADTKLDFLKGNVDFGAIACNDFSVENVDIKAKYGTLNLTDMDVITAKLNLPSEDGSIKNCSFESLTLRAEYDGFYMENVQVAQDTNFKLNSMNFELVNSNFNTLKYSSDYGSLIMKNVEVAGNVIMDSDSLKFDLSNSKFKTFNYKTKYGYIDIDDFSAEDISIKANSTKMTMDEVTSSKAINLDTQYDSIDMENCIAEDVIIKTDSTKIAMIGLFSKTLNLNTKYDSVRMENCSVEDIITKGDTTKMTMTELTTSNLQMVSKYGDIEIQPVAPLEDYGYDVATEYGKITIGGNKMESSYQSLFNDSLTKSIKIDGDTCDINIYN